MTVKWVCSDCDSNNIGKKPGILRCEVCGKPRTLEKLIPVDTSILYEVPEARASPAINWKRLACLLTVTIVKRPSVLLVALLIGSVAAAMLAFYRAGMELSWARITYNAEQLLEFRFNWTVIYDSFHSLLSQIGRIPDNVLALFSLECSLFFRCLSNLRISWDSTWDQLEQWLGRITRNMPPVWGALPRFCQNLRISAYFAWGNVKELLHSGTALFGRLLDKMIP